MNAFPWLLTRGMIAPEHHYVLMREVDMSAALHALAIGDVIGRGPHPITAPIASVHATLHLLLSTIPSVCVDGII